MKKFLAHLLLAFLILPFGLFGQKAKGDDKIKILFIGNSFTYMNNMPDMFKKIAKSSGKEVIVESNTKGGYSFKEHVTRPDMFKAISKRKWDYVILQGYSRELSFPKEYLDTATMPFVEQILDSIYTNNSCTNVMFYMTWGYQEGYPAREEIKTFEMMADSIRNGYKFIGQHYNIPVVPVGMVWKELRAAKDYDLYVKDQFHPNLTGSFLIASTFYSAIFNERNEFFRPFGVKRRIANNITKTAFEYVEDNSVEYGLDRTHLLVQFDEGKRSDNKLTYASNFDDATKYLWDFGDGSNSESQSGVHRYVEEGKYDVSVTAESQCGMREYHQTIRVDSIERGRRPRRKTEKETAE